MVAHEPVDEQPLRCHALAAVAQELGAGSHPSSASLGYPNFFCKSLQISSRADDPRPAEASVQKGAARLIGLIDGTISRSPRSSLPPFAADSKAALLVGLAAALGAAISWAFSEAPLGRRGADRARRRRRARMITGGATFIGGRCTRCRS